jgi:hypothetical protein
MHIPMAVGLRSTEDVHTQNKPDLFGGGSVDYIQEQETASVTYHLSGVGDE